MVVTAAAGNSYACHLSVTAFAEQLLCRLFKTRPLESTSCHGCHGIHWQNLLEKQASQSGKATFRSVFLLACCFLLQGVLFTDGSKDSLHLSTTALTIQMESKLAGALIFFSSLARSLILETRSLKKAFLFCAAPDIRYYLPGKG